MKALVPAAPGAPQHSAPYQTTADAGAFQPLEKVTVTVSMISTLKGLVSRIHLGTDGLFGGALSANLRRDYEASTSKDEMLSEYLPAFWDNLPLSWEEAHANVSDRWNQPVLKGLFWDDGWGFMHRAMLYAMQLLYEHADQGRDDTSPGYSNFDAEDLRARIAAGTLPLYVTDEQLIGTNQGTRDLIIGSGGHVSTKVTGVAYWAITLDVIEIPGAMQSFAAAADYYFWWANRLHSSARETGNLEHWWVGLLCARAALSELVQMAAIVAHEWTHMTSHSAFHCHDLLGTAYGCVEYMIEPTFMYGTWTKLALPQSRNPHLSQVRAPDPKEDQRYRFSGSDTDELTFTGSNQVDGLEALPYVLWIIMVGLPALLSLLDSEGMDDDASCQAFRIELKRFDFWKAGGGYAATWSIPARCGADGDETGAFVEKPS